MQGLTGSVIAALEYAIKALKGELGAERAARQAAEAAARTAKNELDAMHAWSSARSYDGKPYRGMSVEEFRRRQQEAQAKPRWAQELNLRFLKFDSLFSVDLTHKKWCRRFRCVVHNAG